MATLLDLAKLSEAVYGESQPPSGWSLIAQSDPEANTLHGYYGAAYKNDATGETMRQARL